MDTAHEASEEAIHKAKGAAQAIERAREAQQAELVETIADKVGVKLLSSLKEVFQNDNDKTPQEMTVLIQRVPIICTSIMQMHDDIKDLKETNKWVARIVVLAVLGAVLKTVLIP
jgi:hypothetical protein